MSKNKRNAKRKLSAKEIANQRLSNSYQKKVKSLIRSQTLIKSYLLFNGGSNAKSTWVPPLNYAEQHTTTPVQARFLRLMEYLYSYKYPYIGETASGEKELFHKVKNQFDTYIINRTTIGVVFDGHVSFSSSPLPVVVPMIYTQKKYSKEELSTIEETPVIALSYNVEGQEPHTEMIPVSDEMKVRMYAILHFLKEFDIAFTDVCIAYALFGNTELYKESFRRYIVESIKVCARKDQEYEFHDDAIIDIYVDKFLR